VFAHLQSARHAVGSGNTMFQDTKAYFLGRLTNEYLRKTGMRARKKRETESGVESAGKCLLSVFTYMNTFFFFLSAVPLTHSLTKMLSHGSFVTLWPVAHQAPLSMEFSRQEDCSGLLFPPPGDLPDLGIEPTSLVSPALAGRFFIL